MADRFRIEYRALDTVEVELMNEIKKGAAAFETLIEKAPGGRERSLALTKLEEAVMWAVKGITG